MGILAHLDISRAISQARHQVVRQENPLGALLKGLANAINAFVFFVLAWVFDFDSTLDFFVPAMTGIIYNTGQPWYIAAMVPVFMLLLSLSNTLVELFAPDLGEVIGVISFLIFCTLCFDAWTDYPRVELFLAFFEPKNGIEWVLWYIAHPICLAFATFIFEFCAVVFAATSLFSFVWSLRLAMEASLGRQRHAQQ